MPPPRDIRSLASGTSLATRLPAAIVGVSLAALLVTIIVAVDTGRDLGDDLNNDEIAALQGSASFDVVAYINGLERTARALASSPNAVAALDAFFDAHTELAAIPLTNIDEEARAVVEANQSNYIEPLQEAGRDVQLRDLMSANVASLYLQWHYAVDLGVFDEPRSIDDARDGSAWSEVHRVVHPVYREVVERSDLVDLYLIDARNDTIVYSVQKRPDVGTSLEVGPFSGSALASVVDLVRTDPSQTAVTTDLSFYDPALLTPVGVVAGPIMDGDRFAGTLVLMYDSSAITRILTAGGEWEEAGFPPTGQSYLVGADGTIRSEPRSFVENPDSHVAAGVEAGLLDEADRPVIDASGSTVLLQRVNDASALAGRNSDNSVEERTSPNGTSVLSSTVRVPLDDVDWFIVTEVGAAEAEGGQADFQELLVLGTASFTVVLAFLAVAWANRMVEPVRSISERLASEDRDGSIEVAPQSPLEFHRLAESFESMAEVLSRQQDRLATARRSRLELLRRMLPPEVAERIAGGEARSLDEVPQTTVAVVVVVGLSDLLDRTDGSDELSLLNDVLGELDEIAERNGVERIKVVGDAYFASCGHDRPLIDHAPRAVAFAVDAQEAVRSLGSAAGVSLDVTVGLHTGSVSVGTAGGKRVLYDVWGPTVSEAHHLSRRAHRGHILASRATTAMLPDGIDIEPVDGEDRTAWLITGAPTRGAV